MPVPSCSVSIPVAWSILARCSARSAGCPPGTIPADGVPGVSPWPSSSSRVAVSAKTSASPSWNVLFADLANRAYCHKQDYRPYRACPHVRLRFLLLWTPTVPDNSR